MAESGRDSIVILTERAKWDVGYSYETVAWDEIRDKYCNNCPRHSCGGCVYFHHEPTYNTGIICGQHGDKEE